ncbi:hypothetical protein EJK50_0196 [Moraxella catarrhalis]|nr:hypothetical protein EJK50_0196 [Moraxella catarrhalis]
MACVGRVVATIKPASIEAVRMDLDIFKVLSEFLGAGVP